MPVGFWEALFLGLLQGFLEWLPVSSQGASVLVMVSFLGVSAPEAALFSVWLHLGTVFAALFFLRKRFSIVLGEAFLGKRLFSPENRVFSFLLVSTLVSGLVGAPVFLLFSEAAPRSGEFLIALVGVLLVFSGLLQRRASLGGARTCGEVSAGDAFVVGAAQGISALPGVSRSGSTVSFLLLRGFEQREALVLSFLMSVPAVLGAELGAVFLKGFVFEPLPALVALAASFAAGLASIRVFLRIAERTRFWLFCVFLGVLCVLPLFAGFFLG